jgi:hypothetical protein
MFDNIYTEGIIYGDVNLNITAHNIFYDVGNNYTGNPATPVISFTNDNNVSITDMFERDDTDAAVQPRIEVTGGAATTGTQLQLGRYTRENGRTFALANNVVNQTVTTVNCDLVRAFRMDYTITRDTNVRTGSLFVAADSSTTNGFNDNFTENTSTGITLSVSQAAEVISILYTSTNTGLTGTLTYSIAHLA